MSSNSSMKDACEIITTPDRLAEVVDILMHQTEIAVDLEMDSLHHYREKVCLIQVSTRSESWLIDPLQFENLAPLAVPLADPAIAVVMHGADYDVRSMYRDFGLEICNLFDTMIASRLLGITEFGLAALLKARFGIELDKKYQKADWSKRPLSPEMCAYAVADTSDLLALADQLREELAEKGRLEWLREESELVCQARVTEKEGPLFLYCKGAGRLRGQQLAALEELLQARDRQAQLLDRPPFKVLSADLLLLIAETMPKTVAELASVKGMTPLLLQRYGTLLIHAVERGAAVPSQKLPRFPRGAKKEVSEQVKQRLKNLKTWREQLSASLQLDPGVLAPNWLLEAIADTPSASLAEQAAISGMRKWQQQLYGVQLPGIVAAA